MADLSRIFSRIADRQQAAGLDAEADRIARKSERATGLDRQLAKTEIRRLRDAAKRLRDNDR
jgi:hypothetical protein